MLDLSGHDEDFTDVDVAWTGGAEDGHLGNVFAGTVARWAAPSPCPYDICPCTVPANRGMIEGVGAAADDEDVA